MVEREPITRKRLEIKEMPDRLTLETFLGGMEGNVMVYFDIEEGRFVWIDESERQALIEDSMIGQAKTEEGERLRRL